MLLGAEIETPNTDALKARSLVFKCQAVLIGETQWMAGDGDTAEFGVIHVSKLLRGSVVTPNQMASIHSYDLSIGGEGIFFLVKDDSKVRSAWGRQQFETENVPYTEGNHYKVVACLLPTKDNIAMVRKLISSREPSR